MTMQRRTPEPIFYEGGPVACLLLHGFAGSPAELRPLIQALQKKGFTLSAPLLPGHGTQPEELRETRWPDWVRRAEQELVALRERYQTVHVVGFSMGGLIALHLAAHHQVESVTTLAAPIRLTDWRQLLVPLGKYLMPYYQSKISNPEIAAQLPENYERMPTAAIHSLLRLAKLVRKELPRVTAPVQALQGDRDRWIVPDSSAYIMEHVRSQVKQMQLLPGRHHFITLEQGRDQVAQMVIDWMVAHSGQPDLR